jgi:hypothetical protein
MQDEKRRRGDVQSAAKQQAINADCDDDINDDAKDIVDAKRNYGTCANGSWVLRLAWYRSIEC